MGARVPPATSRLRNKRQAAKMAALPGTLTLVILLQSKQTEHFRARVRNQGGERHSCQLVVSIQLSVNPDSQPLDWVTESSCRFATSAKHEKWANPVRKAVLKTKDFAELFGAELRTEWSCRFATPAN